MGRPYSQDLRERVVDAAAATSCHRAAARFGVGVATAIRWMAAARTVEGLWAAIGRLIDTITPDECAAFFAAAGYEPD